MAKVSFGFSCHWKGKFLEICTESDVVAKVRIERYEDYFYNEFSSDSIPQFLVARVIELYKGKITSGEIKLKGIGDWGSDYVSNLKPGRYYFIQYNYWGLFGPPEIGACGEYYIEIEDNYTVSNSTSFLDANYSPRMPAADLEHKIIKKLGKCANISFSPEENLVNEINAEYCVPEQEKGWYNFLLGVFFVSVFLILIIKKYLITRSK